MWDLECFYFVIQHQIVLKLLECHHGVVDCQSELKYSVEAGTFIFRAIKNHRHRGRIWDFERFYFVIQHQIVWKLLEMSSWGSGLSIWIEIVLWKQGLLFLEPSKITDRRRWNMRFGELLLYNSTSDCLETAWVSSWGSGLSIWIEIVLWKQGVSFLRAIQNHRQVR